MEEKELTPEELFEKHKHYAERTLYRMYYNPKGIAQQHRVEFSDLLQFAYMGLWKACLSYDSTKGKFMTHAIMNIKWNVNNGLTRHCQIIRYAINRKIENKDKFRLMSADEKVGNDGEGHVYHDIMPSEYECDFADEIVRKLDSKEFIKALYSVASDKEREIIDYKLKGLSSPKIGEAMNLTGSRVRILWGRLLRKLKASGKVELV
jgi:RNA polymerase sigma factor (sigma-70 family)